MLMQGRSYSSRKLDFVHFQKKLVIKLFKIDIGKLAQETVGWTGADVENFVNQCLLMITSKKIDTVTPEIVEMVLEKFYYGKAQKNKIVPPKVREVTAYIDLIMIQIP